MSEELINGVLAKVVKKMGGDAPAPSTASAPTPAVGTLPAVTEFVGTNVLDDAIGMVTVNVDPKLRAVMELEKNFRFIGILGARTGTGPHISAVDETVKATNSGILTVKLPHSTKGGAGYDSLVIFGAEDVSDARRVVEVALGELGRTFGDVYGNDAGHLEFQYTARASYALDKAFGAPTDKAFGITVGTPAGIGVILTDTAVKAATVDAIGYASPAGGTSYSNEIISSLSDDSGAVRQAIIAAREVGIPLLSALDTKPESTTTPYI